eukprot:scaffold33001_cov68-Attheya_sp.AAC.2
MSRCSSSDTDESKHENNDYDMQSLSSSSDAKETSSSEDFNYLPGHESDRSFSIEESQSSASLLTSNSMFSCDYQSLLTDNASLTSGGENEVRNDEHSSQSSRSTTINYLYESEDIDIDQGEEEDEDMLDNLPPPIDLLEARLLELMMKYSVPLGSYKLFLEWAKLSVNTKYAKKLRTKSGTASTP